MTNAPRRNMPVRLASVLVLIAAALCATRASAAIIQVEKDGSGDFTIIQDAINASQPGDTVLVGPGRYEESPEHSFSDGTTVPSIVGISHALTVRGVDRDAVIIGPETPTGDISSQTFGITVDSALNGVVVEGLTIERTWHLVLTRGGFRARNCRFRNAGGLGIVLSGAVGVAFEGCLIEQNLHASAIFSQAGSGNRDLVVTNTAFRNNDGGMSLASVEDVLVSGCTFEGHTVGIQIWAHSTVQVSNCQFLDSSSVHVSSKDTSVTEVIDCAFGPGAQSALRASQTSHLIGYGNDLAGGRFATVHIQGSGARITLSSCDIGNTGGWSVYAATYETNIDLRNNYWGTPDPGQIEAWIYDRQEDPTLGNVLFDPFSEQPVPAQAESIGGVKARFAPDR